MRHGQGKDVCVRQIEIDAYVMPIVTVDIERVGKCVHLHMSQSLATDCLSVTRQV